MAQLLGLPWGPYVVVDVSDGREEREEYDDVDDDIMGAGVGGAYENGTEGGNSSRMGGGVGDRSRDRNPRGGGRGGAASQGVRTSPRNIHEAVIVVHLTKCVAAAWRRVRGLSGEGGDVSQVTSVSTVAASEAGAAASGVVRALRTVQAAESAAYLELLKPDRRLEIGIISPYRYEYEGMRPGHGLIMMHACCDSMM